MILKELQVKLKQNKTEALLVTHNNMFLGQDILPQENLISQLTGFTGSAGTLLVTPEQAWLFVDGRYTIQARLQTDPQAVKIEEIGRGIANIIHFCQDRGISSLTCNPWCLSVDTYQQLAQALSLVSDETRLPQIVSTASVEVFSHELMYAGETAADKAARIGASLPENAAAYLCCSADDVSWLCNLRAKTLPDTPVFRAYALLSREGGVELFADNCSYPGVKPMAALAKSLAQYKDQIVTFDPRYTPHKILELAPQDVTMLAQHNPIAAAKAAKNQTEIAGYQAAHVQDGVAVVKFLAWLAQNWRGKTELDVVAKLHEYRAQRPLFYSESFATIAAVGAHGAIVHYQPQSDTDAPLVEDTLLLLDSGGQYYNGTTDVTRTIVLGKPTAAMINDFTMVLKSHIALSSAIFPLMTSGKVLDALARRVLWQQGQDYKHGTGHGVGHFLNVHEGPFGMSVGNNALVQPNYVTSIEPGIYKENAYGIRIENMVCTLPAEYDGFLKFSNLTLIPIDKNLINPYLLSSGERDWLNNYHQKVWDCLAPYMDEQEAKWLKAACSPLI